MKIFVKTLNDRTITIEVQADDKVSTLKKKLQEKTGLEPEQQRLVFGSKALEDDNKTLADLYITRESTIFLIERLKPFQIFVVTTEEKTITIEVTKDEKVIDVKRKVERRHGGPADAIQLLYSGKYLDNDKTIADYGIQRDATLVITLRLPGGGM